MSANVLRPESAVPAASDGACGALPGVARTGRAALDWPLPPGPWRRAIDGDATAPACQVQLDARRFVNGRLLAIDRRQGLVRWAAADSDTAIALPFAAFRCLRLMALLPAEPPDSPAWRPPLTPVPYRVEFADGRVWSGSTYRAADDARGLFLFEPVDEVGNLRLAFVPRSAWRSISIARATASQATDKARVAANGREDALKAVVGRAASRRLGQVLIDLGLIDERQLQRALSAQREHRGQPLGEVLVREGLLAREGLALALAVKDGRAIGQTLPIAAPDSVSAASASGQPTERACPNAANR